MRTFVMAAALLTTFVAGSARAESATLQVAFTVEGFRDIEIPVTTFPGEFQAVDSTWGAVTYGGGLVGHWALAFLRNATFTTSIVNNVFTVTFT